MVDLFYLSRVNEMPRSLKFSQIFGRKFRVFYFWLEMFSNFTNHFGLLKDYHVNPSITKFTATCSPMIGQFIDTMILASTDDELL